MEQQSHFQNIIINEDDNLVELMELLEEIDEKKASADLNKISMINNKGGRIYY